MKIADIKVGFEVPVTLHAVVKKIEDVDGDRKFTIVVRSCSTGSPFEEVDVAEVAVSLLSSAIDDSTGDGLVEAISMLIQRDIGDAIVASFSGP